jgi:hypothetical protein
MNKLLFDYRLIEKMFKIYLESIISILKYEIIIF